MAITLPMLARNRAGDVHRLGDATYISAQGGSILCPGVCIVNELIPGKACGVVDPARRAFDHGSLPFVIRRDGSWDYRGSVIARKELVCLFSSVLKRDAEGQFLLETPAERGVIVVEDAPFVAVELGWAGVGVDQVLTFRTNVDQVVTAGPKHPIRVAFDVLSCEPTPYVHVRDGLGGFPLEARIGRAVYYELVALAEPCVVDGRPMFGVWSSGCFFPLGDLPLDAIGDANGDEDDG